MSEKHSQTSICHYCLNKLTVEECYQKRVSRLEMRVGILEEFIHTLLKKTADTCLSMESDTFGNSVTGSNGGGHTGRFEK